MGSVKTIKGVDEETWSEFKSLAAKDKVNMGSLFEKMVVEYKKKSNEFWDDVLKGPKIITDGEAKAMGEAVKKIRKEHGFRSIR
ncbi:hypothetical protein HYU50_04990 [Candidatus Woesearchaeota archaeon]|nr:hypothetical protein [Candidatus Woesearchaeota archaeon]